MIPTITDCVCQSDVVNALFPCFSDVLFFCWFLSPTNHLILVIEFTKFFDFESVFKEKNNDISDVINENCR